ncbi:MAG: helix-turn-helix domain-containing protein [Deltaproteobacteria bacterium]|nr:helix-turn-helix domain-containing protein [Deltaproteobacteria bacterium]
MNANTKKSLSLSNHIKEVRENLLMSKAELARKAGVSVLTIDRIEKGNSCRLDTKRKIILALGYKVSEKNKIFPAN